jgi:hypothetical protein
MVLAGGGLWVGSGLGALWVGSGLGALSQFPVKFDRGAVLIVGEDPNRHCFS